MAKLLLLVAVILVVFWIFKGYRHSLDRPRQPGARAVEDMVRCAHCGLHLPKSESVAARGEFFCSDEHRRNHLK